MIRQKNTQDNPTNPHGIVWWLELVRAIVAAVAGILAGQAAT